MNAGTIVGHITQPNGSPISGAEIWFAGNNETEEKAVGKIGSTRTFAVKTDSRGYFQLPFVYCETAINKVCGIGGELKVSVGRQKGVRKNSDNRFQVNGYLINEILKTEASPLR